MMDTNEIYRLVGDGMMGVAMRMLRETKEGLPYWLVEEYENVEMMVKQHYAYSDREMTGKVKGAVLGLVDDIAEAKAVLSGLKYEYRLRRNEDIGNESLTIRLAAGYGTEEGITAEMDARLSALFHQVWLAGKLDGNAVQMLREFILGEKREFARKVVVGAMMMRCIRYYDRRIVEILMESPMAEAYVAVVMIAMARQRRIDADEESLELYRRYLADDENRERCAIVYNNVMKTFETQNIASEMREKIFPIVREQGMKMKDESANIQLFDENGLNPEWEEKLEDSGVMDKMRRINDLQMNGADIHYESFRMMKATPFFMETAHWFFPFDMRHHQLAGMNGGDDTLGEIPKLINLCDSDRYSLFLMLKGMGVGGLKEALQGMGLGNYDEVREQLTDVEKWKETESLGFAVQVRFTVMNLYRFYNLAPNHSDIINPFARIVPSEGSVLGYQIVPAEIRYDAANILFRARQWETAYGYYESVVEEMIAKDRMIYQKMGYCQEKMERWGRAVEEYGKSDVVVPDDTWTLRHTAYCLRRAGDDEMAAGMYRKVLELDKECVEAIDALADIYVEAGDYADAKPLLYELEYRRGEARDERRLGLCLFMTGKREEALRCLDKASGMAGADAEVYMMRAVAGGDEGRIAEACAVIYDVQRIMEMLDDIFVSQMMESLAEAEREGIKSIINKIILEQ